MEPSERVQLPDDLERDIRALLPDIPFQREHVNARDVLTEESLEELKEVLESNPLTEPWSASPRLYALLRMSAGAGEEDLTHRPYTSEDLLNCGLSDYALPFTWATLPVVIREQFDTATRLLNLQRMVKSSHESMFFRDRILTHRNSKILPFRITPQLPVTQGSFGKVESVLNTRTGLVFARKTMKRLCNDTMSENQARADRQRRLEHFKNEVEILQKLDHEHLVSFCGSYTDENAFALLVQPVAERTLHELLVEPDRLSMEDSAMLRKSFGCLAFGLAWLHSRLIRHKDIKPANILISAGSILFCDFGSAMDAELLDTTRTEGPALMRTPRYVSPETHEERQRNEASDVWSLGCVFLEMLTVLTGSSVDSLLEHIHDQLGRTGLMQGVCYWEGASSDVLHNRIAQLTDVPEVRVVAGWTCQMLEKAPEARPLAATLVAEAQSHEDANPGLGHISSCCAESVVPMLPEARRSHASPPTSPPASPGHGTSGWASFHSPPTTGLPAPEAGVPINNLSPATRIRTQSTQSTHSRVDSAQQITGHSTDGGDTLIFEAPLTPNYFRILEPSASSEESSSRTRFLRLYEHVAADLYRTTRRLVFLLGERLVLSEEQEYWMPLCDTAVVRKGARVIISWSDCNHRVSHEAVNGMTPHSRVYRRTHPNNTLLINFVTEADACDFSTHIREPHIVMRDLIRWPVNLSPYATSGAWGFDTTGEVRKYSVSPEVMYTVQAFNPPGIQHRGPSRGLLVRAHNDLITSTSRIYWLPPAIDIKLESNFTGLRPSVSLMDLFAAGYKSDIRKVHNSGIGRVGVCQTVELSTCSVSWRFETPHERHEFLDGITRWSLRQCTSVRCIWKMRPFPRSRRYGRADFLFWWNGQSDAVVTFRLEDTPAGEGKWITGHLTRPGASESYADLTATIRLTSYRRGEKLNLDSMDAVSASRSETDQNQGDTGRDQTIKIEFSNAEDMTDFQNQTAEYRRPRRDGANAMHISSVSSDGYGVRASGPSLSIQTTSSSSRQS